MENQKIIKVAAIVIIASVAVPLVTSAIMGTVQGIKKVVENRKSKKKNEEVGAE